MIPVIATEKMVLKTNCTDKKNGHYFRIATKEETRLIIDVHKKPRGWAWWVCTRCGKIKQSI